MSDQVEEDGSVPPKRPKYDDLKTDDAISKQFLQIESELVESLKPLSFSKPISYVYNPLEYAWEMHKQYVTKFCKTKKDILFLGMNPGPFGMAQTGVPFGEVDCVRSWLNIVGSVDKPQIEHPKRPILGLDCKRHEVSGQRFWGFFQDLCGTNDQFFKNAFVHNYCPLMFMTSTAKNVTPPEMSVNDRNKLLQLCDDALIKIINLLQVKTIIAVGKFAEQRVLKALKSQDKNDVTVEFLMHPSPINPAANKGWKEIAKKRLTDLNLINYFTE